MSHSGNSFGSGFSRQIGGAVERAGSEKAKISGLDRHGVGGGGVRFSIKPGSVARKSLFAGRFSRSHLKDQKSKQESPESLERPFDQGAPLFNDTTQRKGIERDAMGYFCINTPNYRDAGMSVKIIGIVFGALVLFAGVNRCEKDKNLSFRVTEEKDLEIEFKTNSVTLEHHYLKKNENF